MSLFLICCLITFVVGEGEKDSDIVGHRRCDISSARFEVPFVDTNFFSRFPNGTVAADGFAFLFPTDPLFIPLPESLPLFPLLSF